MALDRRRSAQFKLIGFVVALLLGFVATFVIVFVGIRPVAAFSKVEVEPNSTISTAQNIDDKFSLDFDANIGDSNSNTSTTIPHVTISAAGDESLDYYSFTVKNVGEKAIFDIDFATGLLDSLLRLFDSRGTLLSSNDDSPTTLGQGGSVSALDSYLEFTFSAPGTYVIEIGAVVEGPVPMVVPTGIPTGENYQLQVSLENSVIPFDRFIISKAEFQFDDNSSEQNLKIEGEFTLGASSNGVDPRSEEVKVLVGSSSLTIPAGSFVGDPPVFEFNGVAGGLDVNMEIKEKGINVFKFAVAAEGVELTNIANPLEIRLMIGDDAGTARIKLEGKLQFEVVDDAH